MTVTFLVAKFLMSDSRQTEHSGNMTVISEVGEDTYISVKFLMTSCSDLFIEGR
jgi:hypothetical protein